MTAMVERVARAICAVTNRNCDCAGTVCKITEAQALAAIAAMREPTQEMLQYGGTALDHPNVYMGGASRLSLQRVPKVWDAMIDAATKGE